MKVAVVVIVVMMVITMCQTTMVELSDIQYSIPSCSLDGGKKIVNTFGSLTMGNNLMGDSMVFRVNLNNLNPSCRLCQISPNYCGPMGEDSGLHMAYDTQYNLKIISPFGDGGSPPSSISFSLQNNSYAVVTRTGLCGKVHQLVILVIANIDYPVERDFLLIAHDKDGNKSVPCIKGWGLSDLSCQVSQSYHYVDYSAYNCLAINSTITPDGGGGGGTTPYTPFYYYYESVVMKNVEILGDERLLLCGESWLSIYQRVSLKDYCHPYNSLYVKPKVWYEAALIITSYWLNGNRGEDVWLAMEALERTCHQRESEINFEDSIFYNLTLWMSEEDPIYDKTTICGWIAGAGIDVSTSNITLPYFFYHSDKWWYVLYQYVLEADESMKVYAYLLTPVFPIILVVLLGTLGFTLYHIYYRPPEHYELVQ